MIDMSNDDGSEDYHKGLECYKKKEYKEAAIHFNDSVDKGYGPACGYLGYMQLQGLGVEKSTNDACHTFAYGTLCQDNYSIFMLSKMILNDQTIDYSKQDAYDYLESLADSGYVYALELLGELYNNEHPWTCRDVDVARMYYEKGAQAGSTLCMRRLSVLYYKGEIKDPGDSWMDAVNKSKDYMRRAAGQGDAKAQFYMGEILRNTGFEEAKMWYTRSMNQGNLEAMYRLSTLLYYHCEGFMDFMIADEGMELMRKAAEKGNANAMGHLAFLLSVSPPNQNVIDEAKRWAYKSVEANSGCGYYALATMYEDGVGVPQSIEEALRNYKKAADLGCEWGAERYDQLTNPDSWNRGQIQKNLP